MLRFGAHMHYFIRDMYTNMIDMDMKKLLKKYGRHVADVYKCTSLISHDTSVNHMLWIILYNFGLCVILKLFPCTQTLCKHLKLTLLTLRFILLCQFDLKVCLLCNIFLNSLYGA
jgi:hypothetical protein